MTGHSAGKSTLPMLRASCSAETRSSSWQTIAILIGQLIFAGVFLRTTVFKFVDMNTPAGHIASAGFRLHGPSHWAGKQAEFGAFASHFPFTAGLLFAAVHGPGRVLSLRRNLIGSR